MIELIRGEISYAGSLSRLIYRSAPELFDYIFQTKPLALDFLSKACAQSDGQFSACRHQLALSQESLLGCVSVWHSDFPVSFTLATYNAIQHLLPNETVSHIAQINSALVNTFVPPSPHEICFGHLSVEPDFQRQGVASALLRYVIDRALYMKKTAIVLDVGASNSAAISLYEKCGFYISGEKMFAPLHKTYLRMERLIALSDMRPSND